MELMLKYLRTEGSGCCATITFGLQVALQIASHTCQQFILPSPLSDTLLINHFKTGNYIYHITDRLRELEPLLYVYNSRES
jgi:hypothetical protein